MLFFLPLNANKCSRYNKNKSSYLEANTLRNTLLRYVGRHVQIIYVDRHGNITQRTTLVRSVEPDLVKAYCLTSKAPRVFRTTNILAVQPVTKTA